MEPGFFDLAPFALGAGALGASLWRLKSRLELSRAKHGSLAGHARLASRIAALVPFYEYDDDQFFGSDGAPESVVNARRTAFARLAQAYRRRFARTIEATCEASGGISDLQFTGSYRVPFQFRRRVQEQFGSLGFLVSSSGVTLTDLDGNRAFDVTGSYGVNVFGNDFYKECISEAVERAAALGPVLGIYHPVVAENVAKLREISGLDEVSFHMSGTEAVMQAVRLARYHTRRSHVVRFCGAYHGWWGDVQPGPGNPRPARETYTLRDLSAATLRVIRTRRDIACVLVNPIQALHPNANAPADFALVDSGRSACFDRQAYADWLRQLRAACDENGVALIFDEVFVGFRLAFGGAQEYFGVRADMVTYGKTLGGGLPVGALCGRKELMRRFRDDRPLDICFARGTFNSHPYVMAAMNAFLSRITSPSVRALYSGLDSLWNDRAHILNARLEAKGLPVRVANMSTVWTVIYTAPSRYNWMLQFYLRAEGLALSWVGTGRLIFSLDYKTADFDAVAHRFVAAATAMQRDGWWWQGAAMDNRAIRRRVLRELIRHRFGPMHGREAPALASPPPR